MISEFFIDIGFGFLEGIFALLPEIEWNVNTSAWEYARDVLDMICYLLPLNTIRYFKVLSTGTSFIVNGSSKTKSGSFVYDDITLYQYSVSSASPSYAYSGFYHYDDIYSYLDFYPPTSTQTTIVTPSTYVGDIPEQVQSGELAPEEIPMPDLIDYELAFNYGADLAEAITNISQGMSTGEITFDDYKSIIGYVESPEVETSPSEDSTEATEPSEDTSTDPEPNVGSDDLASPVGDVSGTTFFEKLGSIVTFPFEWIWSKIETFFTTALNVRRKFSFFSLINLSKNFFTSQKK